MSNTIFTVTQACELLNVSRNTIYRHLERGTFKSKKTAGGDHRFTLNQLKKYAQIDPARLQKVLDESGQD